MVLEHYNLRQQPFGATPDPNYLFESETHREALASLLYGIETGRGFFALIAKPGMGKTTLLFRILSRLKGKVKTVFLFQTVCTPLDLLRALLADLGEQHVNGNIIELQSKLTKILLDFSQRSERLVVVIDEAQNLGDSVLEFIRMLSNFETSTAKLIQIVLSGQPELARKLASPNLVQLRQRISIVARLTPFDPQQTADYINHRLRVAGWKSKVRLITPAALKLIADHSKGIPRNINTLCSNALSLGCALKRETIDLDVIREVIADLDLESLTETGTVVKENCPCSTTVPDKATKRYFGAWQPKAAFVTVALFALSGSAFLRNVKATAQADVVLPDAVSQARVSQLQPELRPASDATQYEIHAPKEDSPDYAKRQPDVRTRRILITPGSTISEICAETFKTCHSKELREMLRLNPRLTNPDHLVPGRTVCVPSSKEFSVTTQPSAKSVSSTPKMEATNR
jgi:general secretion pathway protein A